MPVEIKVVIPDAAPLDEDDSDDVVNDISETQSDIIRRVRPASVLTRQAPLRPSSVSVNIDTYMKEWVLLLIS